jgi:hypothetical protein
MIWFNATLTCYLDNYTQLQTAIAFIDAIFCSLNGDFQKMPFMM